MDGQQLTAEILALLPEIDHDFAEAMSRLRRLAQSKNAATVAWAREQLEEYRQIARRQSLSRKYLPRLSRELPKLRRFFTDLDAAQQRGEQP